MRFKPQVARLQQRHAKALLRFVADRYNISIRALLSRRRHQRLVWPRFLAIYFCHHLSGLGFKRLGALFRRHPHAAFHAVRSVRNDVYTNPRRARDFAAAWLEARQIPPPPRR